MLVKLLDCFKDAHANENEEAIRHLIEYTGKDKVGRMAKSISLDILALCIVDDLPYHHANEYS